MHKAIMLAFTSPRSSDLEKDFNEWYTNKHIHDVVRVPGTVSATRFKIARGMQMTPEENSPSQDYFAIYELQAETREQLAAYVESLNAALAEGIIDIHPSLDTETYAAVFALPISDRVTRKHGP